MSEMDIPILFEDTDYVVVNKPAGLVVHGDGKTDMPVLTDWILARYPDTKEVGEPITTKEGLTIYRPGIVHRIDKETSGCLVIAKNQPAYEALKAQFKDRDIDKTYNAFVYGEMRTDDGIIDRPIGRSTQNFRMWSAQRGARGELRDAVTEYKVLKRGHGVSYIEAYPQTGRTHQIRVHFKAINHPVVADSLYAPGREPVLGFTRLALHARTLSFVDMQGHTIDIEAPLPEDFQKALTLLA